MSEPVNESVNAAAGVAEKGAFELLGEEIPHLKGSLDPVYLFGSPSFGLTQFVLWMAICLLITFFVVYICGKKLTLVPKNKFVHVVEYGYEFIRKGVAEDIIGHGFKKHVPFLATIFFFIIICNFIGLVPGFFSATGAISITWALAIISFIYFNYYGIKTFGIGKYLKNIAPSGLPIVMVPIVWALEFLSLVLRLLTLAVRLYGNMFAGHMALGIFALATGIFLTTAIHNMDLLIGLPAVAWFALLIVFYALEALVAFLQAFVFTVLSAVYIQLATHEH